jgi:RNA polymerase sigma factor (sigma-70 family)
MHTELSDAELIHRILQGETSLYAVLVDRYRAYVFTLVFRQTGRREDAEEVAQDVFVKAYRYLADFRGGARFSTWLYTIARTSSASFLRKKRAPLIPLDHAEQRADSPPPGIEQRSRHEVLHQAIRLLGPDDSLVITLFYKGEQSLEEIGQVLGLEPNAVKVRLFRARQRLREKMEKHFRQEVREWQED